MVFEGLPYISMAYARARSIRKTTSKASYIEATPSHVLEGGIFLGVQYAPNVEAQPHISWWGHLMPLLQLWHHDDICR